METAHQVINPLLFRYVSMISMSLYTADFHTGHVRPAFEKVPQIHRDCAAALDIPGIAPRQNGRPSWQILKPSWD